MYRFALILFLGMLLFGGCKQNTVLLPDGTVFKVEIASTPAQAERGLMFRESLGEKEGMLFIFDRDDLRLFWMKNTLIDLDILFINAQGYITSIAGQVPHSYIGAPEEEIAQAAGYGKYVLEINGGAAEKYDLEEGDKLTLKIK